MIQNSVSNRASAWLPMLALAALAFAALGQFAYTALDNRAAAVALYSVALALWSGALLCDRGAARAREHASSALPTRRAPTTFAISAILLAVLTYALSGDNAFTPDNVLAWILSIALFIYAFWEPAKPWGEWRATIRRAITNARDKFQSGIAISWRAFAFGAILLLAAVSFYYRLDSVPAEMTSDHAEKLLDVNDVLQGARPIFFTRNTGREPIQFYLTAAFIGLTGHPLDHLALKWITATLGLLVVPMTFLLARTMFDDDGIAFIAAALVAVSKWLMIISRIGLRFSLTPFFVTPLLYFMIRAFKYQKRNDYLMLGLTLGVGLYGYNAFRIVPLLVTFFFVWWLFVEHNLRREDLPRYALNVLLVILLAAIVFMPLARYMADNPEMVWHRVLTRVSGTERTLDGNPLYVFADNLKNAALMFNVTGDQAWPNNIPFDPALDFVAGGSFVLGVLTAFYRLVRHREKMYAHALIALLILLMPSALALAFPAENPGNARAGGAVALVFIIAALPLAYLARLIVASPGKFARATAVGVIAIILGLIAFSNYRRYFIQYDSSYRDASTNSSEIASAIRAFANSVGDTEHAWILLYPHWVDTRNVAINLGELAWQDHTLDRADLADANDPANKLFVLSPNDDINLTRLQEIFPDAQLRVYHARTPNHDFVLLYVPGTSAPNEPLGNQRIAR